MTKFDCFLNKVPTRPTAVRQQLRQLKAMCINVRHVRQQFALCICARARMRAYIKTPVGCVGAVGYIYNLLK